MDAETKRRLENLEERSETADRRIDEAYALLGRMAVPGAKEPSAPGPEADHPQRRWYDDIPVKWIAVWICGVITLSLATAGFINPTLLESLWKFLSGAASIG